MVLRQLRKFCRTTHQTRCFVDKLAGNMRSFLVYGDGQELWASVRNREPRSCLMSLSDFVDFRPVRWLSSVSNTHHRFYFFRRNFITMLDGLSNFAEQMHVAFAKL